MLLFTYGTEEVLLQRVLTPPVGVQAVGDTEACFTVDAPASVLLRLELACRLDPEKAVWIETKTPDALTKIRLRGTSYHPTVVEDGKGQEDLFLTWRSSAADHFLLQLWSTSLVAGSFRLERAEKFDYHSADVIRSSIRSG